ncbi:MAG: hypothetical protein IT320_03430 [Anaerolineae bacterium]|nr:hypothetical protein [Anaerolineae bacterium]
MHILIDAIAARAGLQRLERLDGARRGLTTAAEYIETKISKAPPQRSWRAVFASDRQRRGFFARLRRGDIRVPYIRTGQSWQIDATEAQAGQRIAITVGTPKPGARYVWGAQQTALHRATGWRTAEQIAHDEGARVAHLVVEAMSEEAD